MNLKLARVLSLLALTIVVTARAQVTLGTEVDRVEKDATAQIDQITLALFGSFGLPGSLSGNARLTSTIGGMSESESQDMAADVWHHHFFSHSASTSILLASSEHPATGGLWQDIEIDVDYEGGQLTLQAGLLIGL